LSTVEVLVLSVHLAVVEKECCVAVLLCCVAMLGCYAGLLCWVAGVCPWGHAASLQHSQPPGAPDQVPERTGQEDPGTAHHGPTHPPGITWVMYTPIRRSHGHDAPTKRSHES